MTNPDVRIQDEGTICLFYLLTAKARQWVDSHVETYDWQWFGVAVAVEHRFAFDVGLGMQDDGLVVRGA